MKNLHMKDIFTILEGAPFLKERRLEPIPAQNRICSVSIDHHCILSKVSNTTSLHLEASESFLSSFEAFPEDRPE